jgi:MerR family transcriptional regulator, heat shock protein HspR
MSFDDLDDTPVYVISVVAQLTGMHAQTLRQYDRLGLVAPRRTAGGGRRYSMRDVERVREIQRLSADGVGLAGIRRVLDLETEVDVLRRRVAELETELDLAFAALQRQERATRGPGTEVAVRDRSTSVVVWRPGRWPVG